MYISTKKFTGYPCTHRQWRDTGHCRFVHGYSREFMFWFKASSLDDKGWVMDFGGFKEFKVFLEDYFDHTFLANADDPELPLFQEMDKKGIVKLRVLPSVGMEGTSKFLFEKMNEYLDKKTQGRVYCFRVETKENEKNSGIYEADKNGFHAV
ncbi:MAG: 6-carboxytetrahydropterin synthase [Bdellovibrionales bacterium]|nr:6-carboxytetrahydropterin synthase [Bdellovibrionales bacterium]